MSIINSIVQFVMDMGGGIFLPFTITVLGLIFKIKLFDSLRNGLRVGAGFLGINVILNMLVSGLQPAIDYYSTKGSGFTVVDIGWEGLSAVAWSTSFALLIVPLGMILNYILIKIRFTKTMDIDIWNYFHMILGASMMFYVLKLAGAAAVPAYVVSVIFGLLTLVVVLKYADWIAPRWQEHYDLPGTTCCNNDAIYIWVINQFTCFVMDKIPGINKIKFEGNWKSDRFGAVGESSVLTFFVGIILSLLTRQNLANTLSMSVTLSAAVILMPKVVGLLMEGMLPVTKAARAYFKGKLGDDYDIYIGMDEALCLGDETGIQLVGIMIPITIAIAFLPGISMFPLSSLGSMIYFTCGCSLFAKGDMFKTLVSTIMVMIYRCFINSWIAPVVTQLAFSAGFIATTSTLVSGSSSAEFNCVLVGILGKILGVW
ncbi:MAG: hypothetical protein HFH10_03235 [Dorea sp.]|nr:hypothetical protein [Dorea sp.]